MHKDKRPILVTGSHRSGTTWIGRTIARHRQVRYVQEPFHVRVPNRIVGLELETWFEHFWSSSQKEAIETSFEELLNASPMKFAVDACRVAGADVKTPFRFVKHLATEGLFRPRILVKDPIALMSAGWLSETFGFQVVCMTRNPLGFVGSLKKAGWDFDFTNLERQEKLMEGVLAPYAEDIQRMCQEREHSDFIGRSILLWNILHHVILDYRATQPDWRFVKHEDVALDPEAGFRGIFDYLGLDYSEAVRKYIEESTSATNPKEGSSSLYQARDAKKAVTAWQERLTEAEIARIQSETEGIARQLYPDSSGP